MALPLYHQSVSLLFAQSFALFTPPSVLRCFSGNPAKLTGLRFDLVARLSACLYRFAVIHDAAYGVCGVAAPEAANRNRILPLSLLAGSKKRAALRRS